MNSDTTAPNAADRCDTPSGKPDFTGFELFNLEPILREGSKRITEAFEERPLSKPDRFRSYLTPPPDRLAFTWRPSPCWTGPPCASDQDKMHPPEYEAMLNQSVFSWFSLLNPYCETGEFPEDRRPANSRLHIGDHLPTPRTSVRDFEKAYKPVVTKMTDQERKEHIEKTVKDAAHQALVAKPAAFLEDPDFETLGFEYKAALVENFREGGTKMLADAVKLNDGSAEVLLQSLVTGSGRSNMTYGEPEEFALNIYCSLEDDPRIKKSIAHASTEGCPNIQLALWSNKFLDVAKERILEVLQSGKHLLKSPLLDSRMHFLYWHDAALAVLVRGAMEQEVLRDSLMEHRLAFAFLAQPPPVVRVLHRPRGVNFENYYHTALGVERVEFVDKFGPPHKHSTPFRLLLLLHGLSEHVGVVSPHEVRAVEARHASQAGAPAAANSDPSVISEVREDALRTAAARVAAGWAAAAPTDAVTVRIKRLYGDAANRCDYELVPGTALPAHLIGKECELPCEPPWEDGLDRFRHDYLYGFTTKGNRKLVLELPLQDQGVADNDYVFVWRCSDPLYGFELVPVAHPSIEWVAPQEESQVDDGAVPQDFMTLVDGMALALLNTDCHALDRGGTREEEKVFHTLKAQFEAADLMGVLRVGQPDDDTLVPNMLKRSTYAFLRSPIEARTQWIATFDSTGLCGYRRAAHTLLLVGALQVLHFRRICKVALRELVVEFPMDPLMRDAPYAYVANPGPGLGGLVVSLVSSSRQAAQYDTVEGAWVREPSLAYQRFFGPAALYTMPDCVKITTAQVMSTLDVWLTAMHQAYAPLRSIPKDRFEWNIFPMHCGLTAPFDFATATGLAARPTFPLMRVLFLNIMPARSDMITSSQFPKDDLFYQRVSCLMRIFTLAGLFEIMVCEGMLCVDDGHFLVQELSSLVQKSMYTSEESTQFVLLMLHMAACARETMCLPKTDPHTSHTGLLLALCLQLSIGLTRSLREWWDSQKQDADGLPAQWYHFIARRTLTRSLFSHFQAEFASYEDFSPPDNVSDIIYLIFNHALLENNVMELPLLRIVRDALCLDGPRPKLATWQAVYGALRPAAEALKQRRGFLSAQVTFDPMNLFAKRSDHLPPPSELLCDFDCRPTFPWSERASLDYAHPEMQVYSENAFLLGYCQKAVGDFDCGTEFGVVCAAQLESKADALHAEITNLLNHVASREYRGLQNNKLNALEFYDVLEEYNLGCGSATSHVVIAVMGAALKRESYKDCFMHRLSNGSVAGCEMWLEMACAWLWPHRAGAPGERLPHPSHGVLVAGSVSAAFAVARLHGMLWRSGDGTPAEIAPHRAAAAEAARVYSEAVRGAFQAARGVKLTFDPKEGEELDTKEIYDAA